MRPEVAVLVCLGVLLVAWCVERAVLRYRALRRLQASCPHNWERIYGYNDPRYPVDRCTYCGFQQPARVPILCPHCHKDIRDV